MYCFRSIGFGDLRICVVLVSLNRICIDYLLQGMNQRPKSKVPVVGTALLNLAEFASVADQKDFDLNIPLTVPGGSAESSPSLCVCFSIFFPLIIYNFCHTTCIRNLKSLHTIYF